MAKEIYNEGRVVGYSAYETYRKILNEQDPDATPATEREWLASSLYLGSSLVLWIQSASAGVYDIPLPRASVGGEYKYTTLCAANSIIGSWFDGQVASNLSSTQQGIQYSWADVVGDYGSLIANNSNEHPSGVITNINTTNVPVNDNYDEPARLAKFNNYLRVVDAVVLQAGEWKKASAESVKSLGTNPYYTFIPNLDEVPVLRINISDNLTQEGTCILLSGFTDKAVVKGETGLDSSVGTLNPQNGDFLGAACYPWANKVILTISAWGLQHMQSDIDISLESIYHSIGHDDPPYFVKIVDGIGDTYYTLSFSEDGETYDLINCTHNYEPNYFHYEPTTEVLQQTDYGFYRLRQSYIDWNSLIELLRDGQAGGIPEETFNYKYVVASQPTYRGDYASDVSYNVGDVVRRYFLGAYVFYMCVEAHTSSSTPVSAYWQQIATYNDGEVAPNSFPVNNLILSTYYNPLVSSDDPVDKYAGAYTVRLSNNVNGQEVLKNLRPTKSNAIVNNFKADNNIYTCDITWSDFIDMLGSGVDTEKRLRLKLDLTPTSQEPIVVDIGKLFCTETTQAGNLGRMDMFLRYGSSRRYFAFGVVHDEQNINFVSSLDSKISDCKDFFQTYLNNTPDTWRYAGIVRILLKVYPAIGNVGKCELVFNYYLGGDADITKSDNDTGLQIVAAGFAYRGNFGDSIKNRKVGVPYPVINSSISSAIGNESSSVTLTAEKLTNYELWSQNGYDNITFTFDSGVGRWQPVVSLKGTYAEKIYGSGTRYVVDMAFRDRTYTSIFNGGYRTSFYSNSTSTDISSSTNYSSNIGLCNLIQADVYAQTNDGNPYGASYAYDQSTGNTITSGYIDVSTVSTIGWKGLANNATVNSISVPSFVQVLSGTYVK